MRRLRAFTTCRSYWTVACAIVKASLTEHSRRDSGTTLPGGIAGRHYQVANVTKWDDVSGTTLLGGTLQGRTGRWDDVAGRNFGKQAKGQGREDKKGGVCVVFNNDDYDDDVLSVLRVLFCISRFHGVVVLVS